MGCARVSVTKWFLLVGGIAAAVLFILNIIFGTFDFGMFAIMLFYLILFGSMWAWLVREFENERKKNEEQQAQRRKFAWCWERMNLHLKQMPGGQGLDWDSGFGRESEVRNYYDGIQNKPFRYMIGNYSGKQQLVLVIYNIDDDDIAKIVTNPPKDLLRNPWLNFRPFSRSGEDRREKDYMSSPWDKRDYWRRHQPSRIPLDFNVPPGGRREEDEESKKETPTEETIQDAVKKLNSSSN